MPWSREPLSSHGVQSIDELRRLYGEPYYAHKNGISINESFWAGLFATENIVLWEPTEPAFYSYRAETGIYEEESADAIKRRISDRLLEASRQMNCFELEKQRSDSRLNSIVAHLRGIVEWRRAFMPQRRRIMPKGWVRPLAAMPRIALARAVEILTECNRLRQVFLPITPGL